jgi:hypothetical protein
MAQLRRTVGRREGNEPSRMFSRPTASEQIRKLPSTHDRRERKGFGSYATQRGHVLSGRRCIRPRPSRFAGAALSPARAPDAAHRRYGVILRACVAPTRAELPDLATAVGVRRPMRATRCVGVKRTRGLIALGPATFVDGPTPRSTSARLDRERILGRDSGQRVHSLSLPPTRR